MTQRKNNKPSLKDFKKDTFFVDGVQDAKQLDLRSQFNALDPKEQQAIINFFNLHNAATWIYNTLSLPGTEYVKLCIELSREQVLENV